ncbi:pantoate--beta-alanine ligase [Bradyrhizobium japonicum]|uniref:pantoate--beta-alanine ligase n=1 Tax=Bradyrhizobium japonicum TaxID=375 RepID=UPI0004B8B7BE|nr:pantoate--beta-alanine ligase [Bradyrhizobium japonicum]
MQTITTITELRHALAESRKTDRCVGFVPTMGYLHDGHLALLRESRIRCHVTVASIFVNPTQFGPTEDLSTYPRDFLRDETLCSAAGVDILFTPDAGEIYPAHFTTFVEPGELARPLCGAFRPGQFRGVATVVCKLFNIMQPDFAFFGQKDFQQCAVVRSMSADLDFPIEIVTVPTVREPDGLAMSSRNKYLTSDERKRALAISRALFTAEAAFRAGEREAKRLTDTARRHLTELDQLQYLELVDPDSLEPATSPLGRRTVLCVAAYIGSTRLIDNVILT